MDNTTEPMTVEQAAESLLMPSEPVAEEAEEQVDETSEDEGVQEAEEVEAEAEEVDAEIDDAEEDDEDDETEAEEQPQTFTVKVDGKEIEVTQDELTRGYAGQQYIQKKMQEAADKRKDAEAAFSALQQQQAQLAQLYQSMQQQGAVPHPGEAPVYDPNDPIGYLDKKAQHDAKMQAYNAQQEQVNQLSQQQSEAQQKAMQSYVQEQRAILEREIPGFADAQTGKQLQADLRATGELYGFTAEELGGIVDARTVKVLHDAMQFRKLQEGKAAVAKKAKKAGPVTKPKAPRKVNKTAKELQAKRKRLRDTGSIQDAVDLIFNG